MKMKCINDDGWFNLTSGKTYEIIDEDIYYYLIINDIGDEDWFRKSYFRSLSEYRNETIDKLLADESKMFKE